MPVQYPSGVMKEHLHCRSAAGLFDVSHMGQVLLRPRSGDVADAARALEALVPVDVLGPRWCPLRAMRCPCSTPRA
ncbi:MAG: hypothetical protein AAFS05_14610, partial [Pseudomonadota bacterium]